MFREDTDPDTEALRREAVSRYKPLIVILAGFAALWLLLAVAILIFLVIHALLQA